ncbi:hypothetical protein AC1031_001666 [Aphanomyces cochlioides]|nr:hypothetical protein AC1031_001666 [Aphanomyces cochlioides]
MGTMVGTKGLIGIAPGAQWISCSAADTSGNANEQSLLLCAQFLLCPTDVNGTNHDCSKAPHVINNSWGDDSQTTFFDAAIQAWRAAGIIPAFSTGNDGSKGCGHASAPGSSRFVIAVGATKSNDILTSFSSRGPTADDRIKPDISAPGDFIVSASGSQDDGYAIMSGTSMAAPHISGTIALYLSAHPGASFDDIYRALTANADTAPLWPYTNSCGNISDATYPNNGFGYGRVNARKIVGVDATPATCTASSAFLDYPGHDLASTYQELPQACCRDGRNAVGCKMWAWTQNQNGTAGSSCSPRSRKTRTLSALTSQPSADFCCADCQVTNNCRAFAWSDHNGGTCWLKEYAIDRVVAPGVVASVVGKTKRDACGSS